MNLKKTMITIEQVTAFSAETAQAIKRLAPQIGKNYKLLTDEDIQGMLRSPHTTLLVARDTKEKRIIGMIMLIVYRIPYVKKAYLDDLIVEEQYRGQGIGKQLMEKAITCAREKGASYVDFTARPTRAASNNLYEKLGFKKRETNVYRFIIDYGQV